MFDETRRASQRSIRLTQDQTGLLNFQKVDSTFAGNMAGRVLELRVFASDSAAVNL